MEKPKYQPEPKAPKPISHIGKLLMDEAKVIHENYCKFHNIPIKKKDHE